MNWCEQILTPLISNWPLIAVAVWGIIVAVRTLGILKKQTNAAMISAQAAKDNIELFINKERARIRVAVEDLKLVTKESGRFNAVAFTLINDGPTKGFVDEFKARLIRTTEKDVAVNYAECRQGFHGESIPKEASMSKSAIIPLDEEPFLEGKDIVSINKAESFIHFYGLIRYHDIFDRKRRATIHLRWTMRFGGVAPGAIAGWWESVGPDDENTETEEKNPS